VAFSVVATAEEKRLSIRQRTVVCGSQQLPNNRDLVSD
jgi:hypothetical protein